jgi:hypothetical protein
MGRPLLLQPGSIGIGFGGKHRIERLEGANQQEFLTPTIDKPTGSTAMLAIIGYLLLAILMSALAKLAFSAKKRMMDWVGYATFSVSVVLSVIFGTDFGLSLPHPAFDSMQSRIIFDLVGVIIFIILGTITSYAAGGVLHLKATDYVQKRRGKQ